MNDNSHFFTAVLTFWPLNRQVDYAVLYDTSAVRRTRIWASLEMKCVTRGQKVTLFVPLSHFALSLIDSMLNVCQCECTGSTVRVSCSNS
jgi:hypothetical protein